MPVKFRILFEATTVQANAQPGIGYAGSAHTPGWSEGVWRQSDTLEQSMVDSMRLDLVPKRLAVLCNQAKIVAVKAYVSGGGRGIVLPITGTGYGGDADQLQVALLCQSNQATALYQSKFWLHALPDSQITQGEFRPTFSFAQSVQAYLAELISWSFPATVRNLLSSIMNVSANGLVTLTAISPFGQGQIVKVIRTLNAQGRQRGGKYRIASVGPGPDQFTLTDWNQGATTGGQVYIGSTQYVFMGTTATPPTVLRSGTRKIGRPFSAYHGRRSKRAA